MREPADSQHTALPPYTVRTSTRARRIRLSVTAKDGLVVVVPAGWRGDAAAIVASKADWATAALGRVSERRRLHLGGPESLMPGSVALSALGTTYRVNVCEGSRSQARPSAGMLEVSGPDAEKRLEALRRWLDRVAAEHLAERLRILAERHGIGYARCRITRAKGRWGSCSGRGTISLNRNLLFLEPELVDALILHELAHVRVMNHSPRFWAELELLDPAARVHRRRLGCANDRVPAWAET